MRTEFVRFPPKYIVSAAHDVICQTVLVFTSPVRARLSKSHGKNYTKLREAHALGHDTTDFDGCL